MVSVLCLGMDSHAPKAGSKIRRRYGRLGIPRGWTREASIAQLRMFNQHLMNEVALVCSFLTVNFGMRLTVRLKRREGTTYVGYIYLDPYFAFPSDWSLVNFFKNTVDILCDPLGGQRPGSLGVGSYGLA